MGYVGIDTQGARRVGQAMVDAAAGADQVRRQVLGALAVAELDSQAGPQLAAVQDGLSALGAGVNEKAELAERFTVDPQGVAGSLNAPESDLGAALAGLVGFAGPADLRAVFLGLPAAGTDAALDGALARLSPVLLPALLAGQRPELDEAQTGDLRTIALGLGLASAGPLPAAEPERSRGGSFLQRILNRTKDSRTGTEVFWNDFWADGRTLDEVLADPDRLLEWVSGTFELDRRLAVATELPGLADILTSVDFALTGGDTSIDALVAEVQEKFPAITDFLPALLAGQAQPAPTAAQLEQTLAFATRLGWVDPATPADPAVVALDPAAVAVDPAGAPSAAAVPAATLAERFTQAVAFLKANRALGSALLPTGFEGSPQPLVFFDAAGIKLQLDLGRRVGVVTDAAVDGLARVVGELARTGGLDLSTTGAPAPAADDQRVEQLFRVLLASQVPPAFLQTPGLQPRFDAALTFVRGAVDGPDVSRRIAEAVAAFRTLAITGAPALTERQLSAIVGPQVISVLGRGQLRRRRSFSKSPEFFLVTQTWGVPDGHNEKIGKFKFTWSFDSTGALSGIRRKKRSTLSRIADTIKSIGKAIVTSFKENPLKAIFQIGKIAVSALALVFPGTQALGIAALALNVGDAAFKAVEGDWLGALTSGLSAFTAGATDVFGVGLPSAVDALQQTVVNGLLPTDALDFVKGAKRALDIGTAIARTIEADSLVGVIGAGLAAGATALGSGGQLLGSIGAIDQSVTDGLVRLGTTLGDVTKIVAPAAGLIAALDQDNTGLAIANGLAVISGGAAALGNSKGAFSDVAPGVDTLFEFDQATQQNLTAIAQGTGVAALVTRAIQAADRGEAFATSSLLAQALQLINDPNKTAIGDKIQIGQRIADIAAVIESIVDSGNNPARVAPGAAAVILQRLQLLVDAASTPPKNEPLNERRPGTVAPPQAQRPGPSLPLPAQPGTLPARPVTLPAQFVTLPALVDSTGPAPTAPGLTTELPSVFGQFGVIDPAAGSTGAPAEQNLGPVGIPGADAGGGDVNDGGGSPAATFSSQLLSASGVTDIPSATDTGDVPSGTADNNTLFAAANNNAPLAEADNHTLFASAGNDTLFGGAGNDRIVAGNPAAIELAGFATPGQQVLGTPFPAALSQPNFGTSWLNWYGGFVVDDIVELDDANIGAGVPGLGVSTGDIPGLVVPTVEPTPPSSRPFDLIRPRVELPNGYSLVGEVMDLARRRPEVTIDSQGVVPFGRTGKKSELELEIFPRAEDGKVVGAKDESPSGETIFTMERQGTSFKGGVIPVDGAWGTSIGVSRTTLDGTTPESYVPKSGSELADGESYALWVRNELQGKVAAGVAVDAGYQQGRLVEVKRVGGTLEITAFPEITQYALAGGGGARKVEATVGGKQTTMNGEQYVVALDQPGVDIFVSDLLRTGGSMKSPPHSVVTRVEGALTGALEFFTVGPAGERSTGQQTETRTRYDDASEQVTGEVVYPGMRVTYGYPVAVDGSAGPVQNVRIEYLDPTLHDQLGPERIQVLEQLVSDIRPLPSPVPKEAIQLAFSPNNTLDGATFVGTILAQTPGSAAQQVVAALTFEQYQEWLKDTPGGPHRLATAYLKDSGLAAHGVDAGGAMAFLERAKAAFSTFELNKPDPLAVPWTPATDRTPLPGTIVTESNVPNDSLPDPELPALFQPPSQFRVDGMSPQIDWGTLPNDPGTASQDFFGGGLDAATVPDPDPIRYDALPEFPGLDATDFQTLPMEPWVSGNMSLPDYAFGTLPDYSLDALSDYSLEALPDFALDDPLSSFSGGAAWDAGSSFDGDWSSAWENPLGGSDFEVGAYEFL